MYFANVSGGDVGRISAFGEEADFDRLDSSMGRMGSPSAQEGLAGCDCDCDGGDCIVCCCCSPLSPFSFFWSPFVNVGSTSVTETSMYTSGSAAFGWALVLVVRCVRGSSHDGRDGGGREKPNAWQ